jgi:hypothetical protein
LFAEFYDFDRGLDPYFKRRLSQVPMAERGKNWIAIMWSRDPQQQSSNNRQYTVTLNSDSLYAETTEVRYVYCSVVFTYISNSMSYLERCEKQFFQYVPDGFSTYFDNTPYSDWNAKQKIGEGYRRLARRYNGYVYQCTQAGTTGNQEPTWTSSGEIKDGSVIWKPIEPDQLKVQIDSIAYSGLQKYSLDEEDTLCSLTIGGRMFLPLLLGEVDENTGELDMSDSTNGIYPRILYPKGEISTTNNFPEYEEYVSPTKDYWRKKLGF